MKPRGSHVPAPNRESWQRQERSFNAAPSCERPGCGGRMSAATDGNGGVLFRCDRCRATQRMGRHIGGLREAAASPTPAVPAIAVAGVVLPPSAAALARAVLAVEEVERLRDERRRAVGAALREWRERLGLSLVATAAQCHAAATHLSRLERGAQWMPGLLSAAIAVLAAEDAARPDHTPRSSGGQPRREVALPNTKRDNRIARMLAPASGAEHISSIMPRALAQLALDLPDLADPHVASTWGRPVES